MTLPAGPPTPPPPPAPRRPVEGGPTAYVENGLLVFTAAHHLARGFCCGSGCRHCPYEPRHVAGTTRTA